MTDTYYVTRGGAHSGQSRKKHTTKDCRLLQQSPREPREAVEAELDKFSNCKACHGGWSHSHTGKPHYEALLAAAAENAKDDEVGA